jgi:hypothetical protein
MARRVFTPEFMRNVVQQIQKAGPWESLTAAARNGDDHVPREFGHGLLGSVAPRTSQRR